MMEYPTIPCPECRLKIVHMRSEFDYDIVARAKLEAWGTPWDIMGGDTEPYSDEANVSGAVIGNAASDGSNSDDDFKTGWPWRLKITLDNPVPANVVMLVSRDIPSQVVISDISVYGDPNFCASLPLPDHVRYIEPLSAEDQTNVGARAHGFLTRAPVECLPGYEQGPILDGQDEIDLSCVSHSVFEPMSPQYKLSSTCVEAITLVDDGFSFFFFLPNFETAQNSLSPAAEQSVGKPLSIMISEQVCQEVKQSLNARECDVRFTIYEHEMPNDGRNGNPPQKGRSKRSLSRSRQNSNQQLDEQYSLEEADDRTGTVKGHTRKIEPLRLMSGVYTLKVDVVIAVPRALATTQGDVASARFHLAMLLEDVLLKLNSPARHNRRASRDHSGEGAESQQAPDESFNVVAHTERSVEYPSSPSGANTTQIAMSTANRPPPTLSAEYSTTFLWSPMSVAFALIFSLIVCAPFALCKLANRRGGKRKRVRVVSFAE